MISKHRLNGQSVLLAKTSVTSKLLYFAKVAFESETLSKVQLTHRILYFQKPILKVTFEKNSGPDFSQKLLSNSGYSEGARELSPPAFI